MYPPALGLVDAMLERYIRFAICASRRFPDYFLKVYSMEEGDISLRCPLLFPGVPYDIGHEFRGGILPQSTVS
jgi:hypothetical protein